MSIGKLLDRFLDHRFLALFIAGVSILALGSALVMQYGFNKLPCHLCYEQRKPYWVTIPLGLIAALVARKSPKTAFVLLLLCGAAFLANMGLSFFHFGVENKWWKGLEGCGGEGADIPHNLTPKELMEWFKNRPIVRCDVPGVVFLGISLTGYNFLLSTFMAGFTFINAIQGRKHGQAAPKA